ncbi:MAG TPA: EamA family transporter [Solirubrobacteraceae bacterium]|nr:EamA family transporter [Solirubrobacteraceae bacterium]
MSTGIALSALSSLALGLSTVALAIAARRVGTVVATAATLLIAFVPLSVLALAAGAEFAFPARSLLVVVVAGALVAVAYLAAIESLRRGPVAVTSPIGSATGAATVAAAFVLLAERPTAGQWAGCAVTAAGCVLASVTRTGGGMRLIGLGPVYALVGVVLGAIANVAVRDPIRDVGPLDVIVVERAATILALAVVLVVFGARLRRALRTPVPAGAGLAAPEPRPIDRRAAGLLLILGLLDAAAFVGFAYAIEVAPAWLVGVISQSGRALAVVAGVILFGERLERLQWTGVGTLALGLVLVSVTSA